MRRTFALLFFVFLLYETATAQVLRYRLSTNSSIFIGEPGGTEVDPPNKMSHPGSENFKPSLKPGVELELLMPLAAELEIGLQFGYNRLAGHTPRAPLYNFFLSRHNPLPDSYKYPDEALIYDTRILNTLATARWYFLPANSDISIFAKVFGGVAFTGTDFTFQDPFYSVEYEVGVLFARGTQNSEEPKMAGFNGGAGLGATFRLSDQLYIYFDATASLIHSDIVNGVPNFDYISNPEQTRMRRKNALSTIAQASIGLIFSTVPDRWYNRNRIWKRNRPFSKRRR